MSVFDPVHVIPTISFLFFDDDEFFSIDISGVGTGTWDPIESVKSWLVSRFSFLTQLPKE